MIEKYLDLNSENSAHFTLQFEDSNHVGIATDQELVIRWLRDLRAGKYKQLQGKMFEADSDTSFCALGVLFKKRIRRLKQKANVEGKALEETAPVQKEIIGDDTDTYLHSIFVYTEDGCKYSLYNFILELNDYSDLAFGTIADIVEIIHGEIRGEDTKELITRLHKKQKWIMVYE